MREHLLKAIETLLNPDTGFGGLVRSDKGQAAVFSACGKNHAVRNNAPYFGRLEIFDHYHLFAEQIRRKIEALKDAYRQTRFHYLLNTGDIACTAEQGYQLPREISFPGKASSIAKALYTSEDGDINATEYDVIAQLSALPNILWWHRNQERRGFSLNGFITHYPDFILYTKKRTLILLEVKGTQLANPQSKAKVDLGRAWQDKLGERYKYLMVFDDLTPPVDGAFTLTTALGMAKNW